MKDLKMMSWSHTHTHNTVYYIYYRYIHCKNELVILTLIWLQEFQMSFFFQGWCKIGISYDMKFPELASLYSNRGK